MKMCFWVELFMFFVLHNYHDINIIFFVFIGLERKVFAIPQLSPMGSCPTSGEPLVQTLQVATYMPSFRDAPFRLQGGGIVWKRKNLHPLYEGKKTQNLHTFQLSWSVIEGYWNMIWAYRPILHCITYWVWVHSHWLLRNADKILKYEAEAPLVATDVCDHYQIALGLRRIRNQKLWCTKNRQNSDCGLPNSTHLTE